MPAIESKPKQFQCRHIFTDGRRCGSPCLRSPEGHEDFCYYHHTSRRPVQDTTQLKRRSKTFTLPMREDRSAVQHAIGLILQKLASNDIDPRRAGLILYGLQIASLNLPKSKPVEEPEEPVATISEIVIDPAFGPLAPAVEYVEYQRPKGSAELMLEKFRAENILRQNDDLPEPEFLPAIQAVASPRQPHARTPRTSIGTPVAAHEWDTQCGVRKQAGHGSIGARIIRNHHEVFREGRRRSPKRKPPTKPPR